MKLFKAISNNLSTKIKLSKKKISKITHLGRFLNRLLVPLITVDLPSMINELKLLAKIVLIPFGIAAAPWGADSGTF